MAQYKVPTLSKVKSLLNERGQLGKVISVLDTPPSNPNAGDKYIVAQNAQGDWSTHDNQIAEYNGSAWEFYTPVEGDFVYVNENDNYLFYINGNWVDIDSLINSIELLGDDGIFFKKNRFGFNTSVLSSVFNIETEETDVDYFDIRKVIVLPSTYEFTGTFNDDSLDWKDVIKVGEYVYYLSYDGTIVKLDSQANIVWSYKYEATGFYSRAILNDVEDLLLFGSDGNTVFYIAKISGNDGSVIWANKYTCSERCDLRGAEKDNTHIYTMHLVDNGVAVAKIDLNGNVILMKKYVNTSLSPYEYDDNEILVQPVGDYVAIGYYPYNGNDYVGHVLKLNKADLSIVWSKSYSTTEYMPITTLIWDGTYYVLGSTPKENGLYTSMIVRLNPDTGDIVDYGKWAYYDNGNLVSVLMSDVVKISTGYATGTNSLGLNLILHLDNNLNLLKAYKITAYSTIGIRSYDNKAYLIGRDGYLAFLGEGLEILAEDSNWEDVTSDIQNKTFPFDVANFSYTTADISVSYTSNTYNVTSLSLTLTKHAQNSYGGGTSKTSIVRLDKDNTLNLAGGLLVSDTTVESEGLIKYDSTSQDLKGYVSGKWKSLTKQGRYNPVDDTVELDVE